MQRAIKLARELAKIAYCPYSGFKVGAAVKTATGVYGGCNVENASYGLTNCAERTAIFNAVSNGETKIELMVIYTPTQTPTAPCGACRQVIREFSTSRTLVVSVCDSKEVLTYSIDDLLPDSFGPEDLIPAVQGVLKV